MYDWPERHGQVDAEWAAIRDRLRSSGIDAPEALTRDTGDLLDFWKRPDLLFAQTCWGPMELGLADHVQVIGQPSYDGIDGGEGELYSSAIVMRRGGGSVGVQAGPPVDLLRGARLAYNVPDSMSGIMALEKDLRSAGESLAIFSERIETGGHRKSIRAVAEGRADVAAIDCRSWQLAKQYEPAAADALQIVGWTAKRKGLPFITAKTTSPEIVEALRAALAA